MIDEKMLIKELYKFADEEIEKSEKMYKAKNFDMLMQHKYGENCFYKAIQKAKDMPKVGEWIPCSDRLPEEDKIAEYYDSVIVTLDNGRVAEGCYRNMDKEWWVDAPDGEHYSENMTGHVIAWMPLPEPYKE